MSNQNQTRLTVVFTKATGAKNLTSKIKVNSVNITGTVIECENWVVGGVNLDKDVVENESTMTLCMNFDLARAILEETEEIYAERGSNGNLKIAICFTTNFIDVKSHLVVYDIQDVEIDDEYGMETSLSPEMIRQRLVDNKATVVANATKFAETIAANVKPELIKKRISDAAMAVSDTQLVNSVRDFVKPSLRKAK